MTEKGHQSVTPATDRGHDDPPARSQDSAAIYPLCQKVCRFRRPVCREGDPGRCPSLSGVAGLDWNDGRDRHAGASALQFFQGHAEAPRSCRRGRLDPRASPPPRCSEPGRGRSAARVDDEPQTQGAIRRNGGVTSLIHRLPPSDRVRSPTEEHSRIIPNHQ
jgi:hypothetical protein